MNLQTALRSDGLLMEWFCRNGNTKGGICLSLAEVIGAEALPPQTSAQEAELIAWMRTLQLGKDKSNIFTNSQYGCRGGGEAHEGADMCTLIVDSGYCG